MHRKHQLSLTRLYEQSNKNACFVTCFAYRILSSSLNGTNTVLCVLCLKRARTGASGWLILLESCIEYLQSIRMSLLGLFLCIHRQCCEMSELGQFAVTTV